MEREELKNFKMHEVRPQPKKKYFSIVHSIGTIQFSRSWELMLTP